MLAEQLELYADEMGPMFGQALESNRSSDDWAKTARCVIVLSGFFTTTRWRCCTDCNCPSSAFVSPKEQGLPGNRSLPRRPLSLKSSFNLFVPYDWPFKRSGTICC